MKSTLKIDEIDRSKTVTFTDKKSGKPKTLPKLGVKSSGVWYSCFQGEWNDKWQAGDTIEVETQQNGSYWNILPPPKPDPHADRLNSIEVKIDAILAILKSNGTVKTTNQSFDERNPPPSDNDIPF